MQSKREFDYKKDEHSLRVVSNFVGNTPFSADIQKGLDAAKKGDFATSKLRKR